jgi:hypothetical protein
MDNVAKKNENFTEVITIGHTLMNYTLKVFKVKQSIHSLKMV